MLHAKHCTSAAVKDWSRGGREEEGRKAPIGYFQLTGKTRVWPFELWGSPMVLWEVIVGTASLGKGGDFKETREVLRLVVGVHG